MLIRSGEVTLRAFDASLSDTVYAIRNHATVRAHLRDTAPIARDSHDRWVRENLIEAKRLELFVVADGSGPVGLALLRNFRGDAAEIGVMVAEATRRPRASYFAAHLVGYYAFECLGLGRLYSYVPLHNAHALSFNRRCGFEASGPPGAVYHELVLTRERSRSHATHRRFRARYAISVEP